MLTPQAIITLLLRYQHTFITGVPDSVFKSLIIEVNQDKRLHSIITNNEGESCALAAGYHLATGQVPVVYMQNSGLGNAVNPLTSLLDEYIYAIPTLLLIGWRAVPGEKDEPQHKRMGEITPSLLSLMGIPYAEAESDLSAMEAIFQKAQQHFKKHSAPFAILFPRKSIVSDAPVKKEMPKAGSLLRESLLEQLILTSRESDIVVTTTGKTSRELYEIRERLGHDHSADFLTVGSMGCAASVALGIAMFQPMRRIILVDGDGACLMRMESLATIGHLQPKNLWHIIVDNNAYESTGSQKTQSSSVDFPAIARACQYRQAAAVETLSAFKAALNEYEMGPVLIAVKSTPYSRSDLGRPKTTPRENKIALMERLGALLCKQ